MMIAVSRLSVRPPFLLSVLGAAAAGAFLRLWRLGEQILLGDELHAVRAVLERPLPEILWTYGTTDVCLPVAGFARWLLERGVELSETAFRGPVVASGLLLLAAAPFLARPWLGRRSVLLYPWLVALSPGLVLYGRIARSYGPAVLLALVAVAAFFLFQRRGSRVAGAVYSLAGAGAVYTLLVVAPFVLGPLAYAVLAKISPRAVGEANEDAGPGRRPSWLALAAVTAGLAAGCALFLVPGWESLRAVVAEKGGRGAVEAETVLGSLRLLAGSGRWWLAAFFWAAAALGLGRLWRRDRAAALFTLAPVTAQMVGVAAVRPFGLNNPLILGRYLLAVLPLVLVWVAIGVVDWGRPGERGSRKSALAAGAVGALVVVALAVFGTFAEPRFRYSSFLHHDDFLAFHRPLPELPAGSVPGVYLGLESGGDGAVLELPAFPDGENRCLHLYQDRHRRDVLLATPVPVLNDRRLGFRNRVVPLPGPLLASGARWLVVHLDLEAEELAVELPPGVPRGWDARAERLGERFRVVAPRLVERLEAEWGEADLRGEGVVVWDLERLRRAGAAAGRDCVECDRQVADRD